MIYLVTPTLRGDLLIFIDVKDESYKVGPWCVIILVIMMNFISFIETKSGVHIISFDYTEAKMFLNVGFL